MRPSTPAPTRSPGSRPRSNGMGGQRPGGSRGGSRSATRAGAAAPAPRRRPALTSRAAILAVVVCAIMLSLAYPLREYIAQRSEIAELREEQATYQDSIAELEGRQEQLDDPQHLERAARERLHYQYPDEDTYVVLDGQDSDEDADGEDSGQPWYTVLWESVLQADAAEDAEDGIPEAEPPPRN